MVKDIQVRKVAQYVQLFVWFRHKIITKEPSPELRFIPEVSAELIDNLSVSVWVESFHNEFRWKDYFRIHFERMTSSPYLFANYVAYAFYILKNRNAYKFFIDVLSMSTSIVLHCWQRKREMFLNTCVDLFCAFFETEIRPEFEKQGGWTHFNEHLEKDNNLETYRSLIDDDKSLREHFKGVEKEQDHSHYMINDVVIVYITRRSVETDKKAIAFAESVESKISELCEKEFSEILMDFMWTDSQVEALCQQTTGGTSGGMGKEAENTSSQKIEKDASQNVPNSSKSDLKKQEEHTVAASLEVQNSDNVNSQAVDASDNASHLSPKRKTLKRVKKYLDDISEDISKLSDIAQLLCQATRVQAPVRKEMNSNV